MNTATAGKPREWSYTELCQTCRDAVEAMDGYRFLIGDTALEIESHYGDHDLEEFSKDISQNHSTVKGWRRVAKAYSQKFRAELFEEMPNLTYTYLRDALRLGDDPDVLYSWLQHVTDNNWTADGAARELTKRLGHQTRESIEGWVLHNYDVMGDEYIVKIRVDKAGLDYLQEVYTVTIKAK